jgi:acyl-CoA synthetase (AMP-forming)/AMP-acid ligase II
MLEHAARQYPDRLVRSLLTDEAISFDQLARSGPVVARSLVAAGIEQGAPVAVLIKSPFELLQALFGIADAGAVIVPLSVSVGLTKAYLARLNHILDNCGARYAVVDDTYAEHFAEVLPHIKTFTVDALSRSAATPPRSVLPIVNDRDLALIQYTSGSTSNPKGVALTHRNILTSLRAMNYAIDAVPGDVLCHWLPLSHDMGLFSTLTGVAGGWDIYLSPPQAFIKQPDTWLRRSSEVRASILVGPNFSYQYLMEAVPPDEVVNYDLGAVRIMLNGAEPIDPELLRTFPRHFAASNLVPHAMTPCYGLAEATLAVTFAPVAEPAKIDWVDRSALNEAGQAHPVAAGAANARAVVSCGVPQTGMDTRIVRDGVALPERTVGEIEIRGDSVMRGYYRDSRLTRSSDGWCPTGDLGYLAESHLYVTGRLKEMMILGGQNYYPQDVEDTVQRLPGIYQRHAVAVVLPADSVASMPERIAVLAEVSAVRAPHGPTVSAVRSAAATQLDGASVDVVLLRPNALLRTTSGKFQRLLMRDQLLQGGLRRVLVHVRANEPVPTDEVSV